MAIDFQSLRTTVEAKMHGMMRTMYDTKSP